VQIGLAEAILSQGRYQEVLTTLDEVRQVAPSEDAGVHALRAGAYEGLGELKRASKLYKEALDLNRASVPARLGLARLALKEGRPADARPLIDTALKVDDRSVIGWGLLGDLERLEKNPEAAKKAYSEAVKRTPIPNVLEIKLSQVETELGNYAGARRHLAAVRKVSPDHPMVAITEGLLEYRLGNLTKAQSTLETGLSGDPDNQLAAYYLGVLHYTRGHWADAVDYLSRAESSQEENEGFYLMLGAAKLNTGDVAGAATLLDQHVDVEKASSNVLALMAPVKFAQGELEAGRKLADRATAIDPTLADLHVDLGLRLLQKHHVGKAVVELEDTLAQQPDSERAQTALFIARVQAGDRAGALALAQRMRRDRPEDGSPLVLMALLRALEKDVRGAEELLRQALELDPKNVSAAANLAGLAVRAGRLDEARQLYERMLQEGKDDVAIRLKAAMLELKAGNRDEFERKLRALVADHPEQLKARVLLTRYYTRSGRALKALSLIKDMGKGEGQRPAALAVSAEAQMAVGDLENAVRSAEAWVRLSPGNAAARYLLAKAYAATRNRDGLQRELFAAIDLEPGNPAVDSLVNQLISTAPSLDAANELVDRLRKTQPDLPYLLDLDAQRALKAGRYDDALRIYRHALKRHPDDPRWPTGLHRLYRAQGEFGKARQLLDAWLKRHPDNPRVHLYSGNLYLAQGKTEQASRAFSAVLEKDPDNVAALNNLGWLLLDTAPRSALHRAKRGTELAGRTAATLDTLGMALLANGETDQAAAVLAEASGKMPESKEIRIHLAQAWNRQGQATKAREVLRSILADAEAFSGREDAERLLQEIDGDRLKGESR